MPSLKDLSVEPDSNKPRSKAVGRARATSLDRGRRRFKQTNDARRCGTLPADFNRARDPDFSTLTRGFTLNGQPILPKEDLKKQESAEESGWIWWSIYTSILGLTTGNIIVSLLIVRLLGLGLHGSQHLDVDSERNEVDFWSDLHLNQLIPKGGLVSGYKEESLSIIDPENQIVLMGFGLSGPRLQLSPQEVSLHNIHDFNLKDPLTQKTIFSTSDPHWSTSQDMASLQVDEAEVGAGGIVSPLHTDLKINDHNTIYLRGSEGVRIGGKKIVLVSEDDIYFNTTAGYVQISSEMHLNTILQPIGGHKQGETAQYKLCACMPSGKLFKIAVPIGRVRGFGCHSAKTNPC